MEQMKMQVPEEESASEPLNMRVEIADTLWDYLTTNNKTAKELAAELGTSKSTVGRILNDGGADRRSTRSPTQQDAVIAKFYEKFGKEYEPPKSWVQYAKGRKFAPIRGEVKEESPAPKQASWFEATIPSTGTITTDHFALYGKWAGKLIRGAPIEALYWYETHILESMGQPEYEQYREEDQIRLKKIREEMVRQRNQNGFVVYTPPEYLTEPMPTPKIESWAVKAYSQGAEQRSTLAGVPQVAEQLKSLVKAGVLTLEEAQKALYRQVDQLLKD